MKNRTVYIMLAVLGISLAGVLYYYGRGEAPERVSEDVFISQIQTEEPADTEAQTQEQHMIYAHICGAVVSPGVYGLPEGSRISDGIAAAGGFAEDADTEYYNLALLMEDGMQVRVPTVEEAESLRAAAADSSDGLVNINTAGLDELMSLPGIGEVKAEAIIEYRSRNGPFEDISDIMRVSGIKESAYQQIQYRIKVG